MRNDLRLALIGSILGVLSGCASRHPKPLPEPLQEMPAQPAASAPAVVAPGTGGRGTAGGGAQASAPPAGVSAGSDPGSFAGASPVASASAPGVISAVVVPPAMVHRGRLRGASAAGESGSLLIGNGAAAREVPDGSDDDIIARRLRRAAEFEADPALREKLWKEYVDYRDHLRR